MSKVTIDLDAPPIEFYNKGIITALYRKGNPSATDFHYYACFQKHLKEGNNRTTSQKFAADDCGVDVRTIIRAIKKVEKK